MLNLLRSLIDRVKVLLAIRAVQELEAEALDAGANDYITKPFGIGELRARIRVALRLAGGARWTLLAATGAKPRAVGRP